MIADVLYQPCVRGGDVSRPVGVEVGLGAGLTCTALMAIITAMELLTPVHSMLAVVMAREYRRLMSCEKSNVVLASSPGPTRKLLIVFQCVNILLPQDNVDHWDFDIFAFRRVTEGQ